MTNLEAKLKLRKVIGILFLSMLPIAVIMTFIFRSEEVIMVLFFVWSVLIVILTFIVGSTKCPNCSKLLFGKRFGVFIFWSYANTKCMNCNYRFLPEVKVFESEKISKEEKSKRDDLWRGKL